MSIPRDEAIVNHNATPRREVCMTPSNKRWTVLVAAAAVACTVCMPSHAVAIANGGFELGFSGWTRADQIGSDGTFALQTGTTSPVNADPVPAPPQGLTAAMSDAQGPGSHVLYQDFTVTGPVGPMALNFSLFIGNRDTAFFVPAPATLDFSTPALNQQARVDILAASTDPFSVAAADVLLNAYRTLVGDPLVSGYANFSIDVTALLAAHVGETLRLRFAEVDNVFTFQLGVDDVSFAAPAAIPEPSSGVLMTSALLGLACISRRRRLLPASARLRVC
jgi:hypothetical protein